MPDNEHELIDADVKLAANDPNAHGLEQDQAEAAEHMSRMKGGHGVTRKRANRKAAAAG